MRKTIAAATIAASLAVGGLAGSALGGPSLAGAAGTASEATGWVQEALGGLVDDGTITEEQADAVGTALDEARPEHGPGHRGGGRPLGVVAESLGVTVDELRAALDDGRTIAEVAEEQGVDPATVVDALVAAHREHVQEAVDAGELTQEEADERLAGAEERAAALVEDEAPPAGPGGRGPGGEGRRPGPHGARGGN